MGLEDECFGVGAGEGGMGGYGLGSRVAETAVCYAVGGVESVGGGWFLRGWGRGMLQGCMEL